MTYQTYKQSSFEEYCRSGEESAESIAESILFRERMLATFPCALMLEVSYPEMDYANRWCWQQFGPADGDCNQKYSEYPACLDHVAHTHQGRWTTSWFVKTDYDFGFNEWYFQSDADLAAFLAWLPNLNWGEKFPQQH